MEKAKIAQRAQREAEEAEERRTAEAAAAEEDARQAERLISSKRAGLPAEPSPEDPQAMSVLIRLPNGGRLSRRLHTSNPFCMSPSCIIRAGESSRKYLFSEPVR